MALEFKQDYPASIKVIGVGGGGNNTVDRMVASSTKGVELISINTDLKSLENSKASQKIQIGTKLTKGLGSGSNPEIGEKAAFESEREIKEILNGADMVFITAGMGGGTGTGAAPVVASIAKKMGILTVGIVTKPFPFEGKKRMENALIGIEKLKQNVDSLIVILNGNLLNSDNKKITFVEAFNMVDEILRIGVQSIIGIINNPGLINLDFADISTIMRDSGLAHMGIGISTGDDRALKAAEKAINSPLLETSLGGATGLLVNITGGSDLSLLEINEAVDYIQNQVHKDAEIIFGTSIDETLGDKICITLIATGIENKPKAITSPEKNVGNVENVDYNIDIPDWLRRKKKTK
jgi:cell division protein FtsZ